MSATSRALACSLGLMAAGCGPAQVSERAAAAKDERAAPSLDIHREAKNPASLDRDERAAKNEAPPGDPLEAAAGAPPIDPSDPELTEPRIGAIGEHVRIMPRPSHEGLALGGLRMGMSVPLASSDPIAGDGCARGFYRVEPRGYVCLDRRTTLDLRDPYYQALRSLAPRHGTIWPYRYAHSRGAPMYSRVPTPEEWEKAEKSLGPPGTYADLGEWAKGHEELIEDETRIAATDPVPWFLAGGKRHVAGGNRDPKRLLWKTIPNGSMLAYARAFEMHGRVWLVTPDITVVPADRVQHMRRSQFRGVELGGEVTLPLAWNPTFASVALHRRTEDGGFTATDEQLAPKSWRMIADEPIKRGKHSYFPLRERDGRFLRADQVSVARPRKKLPVAIKPGEKWVDARITPGTLVAYQGLTPVFATLFSPGKGGHPVPGLDHTKMATTQTGIFRYEWKEWVATMSNEKGEPKVLWFSDVPHIQYIRAPLAQHVTYWHEDFGKPKSAECLNVSPIDGRWLFGWTDPQVPEGWNAVGASFGPSTAIMINGF